MFISILLFSITFYWGGL